MVPGSPPNSSDSLIGLKFGQKIYFEDVGIGPPAKSGGGSSSASASRNPPPPAPVKKVKNGGGSGSGSGFIQGGQPPRCQVEGCKVDLSDAKAYYSRHKVCGMHSKSPKVIVAGIEQRFCQQCSRFHLLPEFDQGKRSCRRRLAGHNERRRKPPPGSLLSSRYSRLSSSIFENSGRGGGFLMDFSAHSRLPARDPWPATRSLERVPVSQATATGKFLSNPWQSNSESPPSEFFLQGPVGGGAGFSSPGIPPGDYFTGVSDSGCALSLLSNQPWGSRNRASGLGMNNLMHMEGAVHQSTAPQGAAVNHFPNTSWGFKGNEAAGSSHEMASDLGLVQISQPLHSEFSSELEATQRSGRQYMGLEHSRQYNSSSPHIHWSL